MPQYPSQVSPPVVPEALVSMGMSSKHDSLQDSEDIISFIQQEDMEDKRLHEAAEEEK